MLAVNVRLGLATMPSKYVSFKDIDQGHSVKKYKM